MTDLLFAVDELEVDVLEPRLEMSIHPPPSTCVLIQQPPVVGQVERLIGEISTCIL